MKKTLIFTAVLGTIFLSGCANVTSGNRYAGYTEKPAEICIVKNPRVTFSQALDSIELALAKRDVKYHIVTNASDCKVDCAYMLNYEARRSWDFTTYLGSADLVLKKNGQIISSAKYQAGSMTLTKWGKTEERIDGMVGELLGE